MTAAAHRRSSAPLRRTSTRLSRRARAAGDDGDAGRAIIEVIFLGALMLIPVIYVLIALLNIQAGRMGVSQAARDAGRAMDGSPSISVGEQRALDIAQISLHDQGVNPDGLDLIYVSPGTDCGAAQGNPTLQIQPTLNPGDVYDICVITVLHIPGVPTVISGSSNKVIGVYTLHVGELREGSP